MHLDPRGLRTARDDEDLIEIWSYVATENIVAADRILDAIEARWRQLAQHPYSGVARDDIAPEIRHLIAGKYLILYRIVGNAVEIIRVLNSRREIAREAIEKVRI